MSRLPGKRSDLPGRLLAVWGWVWLAAFLANVILTLGAASFLLTPLVLLLVPYALILRMRSRPQSPFGRLALALALAYAIGLLVILVYLTLLTFNFRPWPL